MADSGDSDAVAGTSTTGSTPWAKDGFTPTLITAKGATARAIALAHIVHEPFKETVLIQVDLVTEVSAPTEEWLIWMTITARSNVPNLEATIVPQCAFIGILTDEDENLAKMHRPFTQQRQSIAVKHAK
ncbi:hypothetical protein H6G89_09050 [Oscillatoria sp. FACHB-1407]|uniref:hypothetical protein n=1 Tax=Oscillatoria sp. FACHB-1407 TaxID=2692847 RepID=UPI001682A394|nr:hypothetical protein [Oscillatoria sp. FACHB-1407]MBD2461190.1 hypothetical protein [Oscillatoria sp. FACHB-1407]